MTVQELISRLSELDPEREVFYEVNGDTERTGDFFSVDELRKGRFIAMTYGGYDEGTEKSEYTVGDPVDGVVIK